MPKFFHIVQVHPVENGEPNLYKIIKEFEFEEKWKAEQCVNWMNDDFEAFNFSKKAVYVGMVNDETGELV